MTSSRKILASLTLVAGLAASGAMAKPKDGGLA